MEIYFQLKVKMSCKYSWISGNYENEFTGLFNNKQKLRAACRALLIVEPKYNFYCLIAIFNTIISRHDIIITFRAELLDAGLDRVRVRSVEIGQDRPPLRSASGLVSQYRLGLRAANTRCAVKKLCVGEFLDMESKNLWGPVFWEEICKMWKVQKCLQVLSRVLDRNNMRSFCQLVLQVMFMVLVGCEKDTLMEDKGTHIYFII